MTTAGDPAPTNINHRMPSPYRAVGAGSLLAAAFLILAFAVLAGGEPTRHGGLLALALAVTISGLIGLFALAERRADAREQAAIERQMACEEWVATQLQHVATLVTGDVSVALRQAYAAGFVDCADGTPKPGALASVTRLEPH